MFIFYLLANSYCCIDNGVIMITSTHKGVAVCDVRKEEHCVTQPALPHLAEYISLTTGMHQNSSC